MRDLARILATAALLVFVPAVGILLCASHAQAFAIYFDKSGFDIPSGATSDTLTVQVLADIDVTGLELLGVAVIFDPDQFTYVATASSAPSYMLYSPASGTISSVYMRPTSNPPRLWPAPPPDRGQVEVAWQIDQILLDPTQVTGSGLLLATLTFHFNQANRRSNIELALDVGGTIVRVNGEDIRSSVELGAPVYIDPIPEPATALLVGLGLVALSAAGRRHRARSFDHQCFQKELEP